MIANYIQGEENIVLFLKKSSNCLDTIEHVGYTLFNLSFCELNKPFLRHVTKSEFIVILKQRSIATQDNLKVQSYLYFTMLKIIVLSYCYNPFVCLKFNHKNERIRQKVKNTSDQVLAWNEIQFLWFNNHSNEIYQVTYFLDWWEKYLLHIYRHPIIQKDIRCFKK